MQSNTSTPHPAAYEALARATRRRRKDLKLTQQQLGDLAGCGRLLVHNLETGKSSLRLDKLLDVLEILGLQLSLTNGTQGLVDESDANH